MSRIHIPIASLALLTLAACGDDPRLGDDCPDEGAEHHNLICEDGSWTALPDDLFIETAPPDETTAGQPFDVSVKIVGPDDRTSALDDVEVTLELNRHTFATGEPTDSARTDAGVADFQSAVEIADTGLVLFATADDERLDGVSTSSEPFDVSAATPDPDHSAITGETGIEADGQTIADVEIELRDEFDNPVTGVVPEFEASGQGNDYRDCETTDENGIADCGMTSTAPGEKTLEITDPIEVTGETIEFVYDCDESGAPFGGGTGSTESPYRICTAKQLDAVGDGPAFMESDFVLARDIDAGSIANLNVIGDASAPFEATFDGNDRTIENLTIDRPSTEDVGLFGYVGSEGVVRNLTLENADVVGDEPVGTVAGINTGLLENIEVSGWVEATHSGAGFVGLQIDGGVIDDGHADVDVQILDSRGAGFAAQNEEGTITGSTASGDVLLIGDEAGGGAGFVSAQLEGSIIDSHASGDVEATDPRLIFGGFVAIVNRGGTIENSSASGDLIDLGREIGGFVGRHRGNSLITDCYATGEVSGDDFGAGGFAGVVHADIRDSFATGDVTNDDEYAGGFAAFISGDGTVQRSYSTGESDAQAHAGGFAGGLSGTVENSYWDETTSNTTDGFSNLDDEEIADATPLTTDEFADEQNFEGWDFDDIWKIGDAPDGETRPILQWQ